MTTILWIILAIGIAHEIIVAMTIFFSARKIGHLETEIKISKSNEDIIKVQYENILKSVEKYRVALAKGRLGDFSHIELQPDTLTATNTSAPIDVPGISK